LQVAQAKSQPKLAKEPALPLKKEKQKISLPFSKIKSRPHQPTKKLTKKQTVTKTMKIEPLPTTAHPM
jgi:hypothetical protein